MSTDKAQSTIEDLAQRCASTCGLCIQRAALIAAPTAPTVAPITIRFVERRVGLSMIDTTSCYCGASDTSDGWDSISPETTTYTNKNNWEGHEFHSCQAA